MLLLVVLLRIVLSAIFAVAGITKLLDLRGTREAVKNFGAPEPLAPALSVLLPIAELSIAVGLLFNISTSVSALGGLLLLCLFAVAISVNLAQGRTHDCHCFGQLHSRPLGWPTLVRNVLFAVAAGIVLWQALTTTIASIPLVLGGLGATEWALLLSAVALAAVALGYVQRREAHRQLAAAADETPEGLPLHTMAPAFELEAYEGGRTSLTQLIDGGKPLLLIFTSPTCGPCVVLFEEIKDWQRAHSEHLTIALISKGTIKENFVNVARNDLGQVLMQKEREVAEQYQAHVTPTAVLVNTDGRIASKLAAGADEIRRLLQTVLDNSNRDLRNAGNLAAD